MRFEAGMSPVRRLVGRQRSYSGVDDLNEAGFVADS